MDKQEQILRIMPGGIKDMISRLLLHFEGVQEIRIRVNRPILIMYQGKEINTEYIIRLKHIKEMMELICDYSAYAYEEEMRQGYITIEGGHRIGIAGKTIINNGMIKNMKNIAFINIRVASQRIGCANEIIGQLVSNGIVHNTLIMSPPGGGKTTLLRDIIRLLSDGNDRIKGMNVGVVDERSEICACYQGVPQNDVGIRTDVLDGCPKTEGMIRLVRSMAPAVIAVDEIGSKEDCETIEYVLTSGCRVIATIHGSCIEDLKKNIYISRCLEKGMFSKVIIPKGPAGTKDKLLDIGNITGGEEGEKL